MGTDKITTIVGGIGAAASAAQVALGQVQPGTSLHSADYMQLLFSVAMAVFAFFTNKQGKTA